MFPRFCRCVFLITGALMVVLALALALSIQLDVTQAQARQLQRADVAQAVSQLESGCLTCHDLVNTAPQAEAVALVGFYNSAANSEALTVRTPEISHQTSAETAAISLHDQLNAELIDVGHRILDLPDVEPQRFGTMVEDYLRVVHAHTGATPDDQMTQWALGQLDGIEDVLRDLENQASPYQLVRQDNQFTTLTSPAAISTLQTLTTVPSVAALVGSITLGAGVQMQFARLDVTQLAMPQEVVYATHRRGPPAGVALDSVL